MPLGEGLFAFSSLEDIVAAVECINRDYATHSRGAAAIAHEYFSHDRVLTQLVADAGL